MRFLNSDSHTWTGSVSMYGILITLIALTGCGTSGPPRITGSVKITVTYDGKPVTAGIVSMIVPDSAKGAFGNLDSTGTVSIKEVETGNYVVTLLPPEPPPPGIDNPVPRVKSYDNLPAKFRSESTSTLKAEVKEGENEFTFELKE